MRKTLPLALGAALLLCACASSEPKDMEVKLPTQVEADAAARQRIDKSNADEQYKQLEAEINGESGKP